MYSYPSSANWYKDKYTSISNQNIILTSTFFLPSDIFINEGIFISPNHNTRVVHSGPNNKAISVVTVPLVPACPE